ncbi:MAG: hypothetical protein JO250_05485 [Armatimonadetes bacterium]|nr:hypothetical protein [Armatimonadota bacterium]
MHLRNFRLPDVDQSSIQADQVAYFSVIDLPFRLRLGRYGRSPMSPDGAVEVAWLNRVDLPRSQRLTTEQLPLLRDQDRLNTRLIVIENVFRVQPDEVEQIRGEATFPLTTEAAQLLTREPGPQLLVFPNHDRPLAAIRRFIDLYHAYCPPEYWGDDMVRPIWMHDYYARGIVFGVCLRPQGVPLPDRFAKVLLRSDNPFALAEHKDLSVTFRRDAPLSQRRRLLRGLRDGEDPSLADQMLLLSHSYHEQHNLEMAVITAVAALEAAMFVFARKRLEPKLGKSLAETFIREQGAYMLVEALPRLLFSEKNLPEEKVFKNVKNAINARNYIMHGKLDKSGKPKHLSMGHLGIPIMACKELLRAFQSES